MRHPIGANVQIRWMGTPEVTERYFSFGQWNDDDNEDEYGVPDHDIFFYAFEGVNELERMKESPEHDFYVVSWTLKYEDSLAYTAT